ncbi:MAG: hypothetical protein OXH56_12280, partial [Gemmatimonadetes bacterium]|nr:hypothetical protein [Gemmatimonadota bacterium]
RCEPANQADHGVLGHRVENLVIWEKVFERNALLARTLHCMGVTGNLQVGEGVVHLVVEAVWDPKLEDRTLRLRSRDFR